MWITTSLFQILILHLFYVKNNSPDYKTLPFHIILNNGVILIIYFVSNYTNVQNFNIFWASIQFT